MREFLLFLTVLILTGCSFKTVVHPYPRSYNGNPDEAVDKLEIQRSNDYFLISLDTTVRLPLSYSDGSLHVSMGILTDQSWRKNDSFINPISEKKYAINALAKYNPEFNADEFVVTLSEFGSDSALASLEGLVEDATVFMGENAFGFTALDFWEPEIKRVQTDRGTEWHHYPFGGTWSLSINDVILGEIIQGSPVVNRGKIKTNYGVSYTFVFIEMVDELIKSDLVNAMLAYLALVDMEYYYYECDLDNPQDQACPGSIIVR